MKDKDIYKLAFWSFVGCFICVIFLMFTSCEKDTDILPEKISTSKITKVITELRFEGRNSGVTIEGIEKRTSFTKKAGPDSLILSQSPLIEFKYNLASDLEYDITYTINEIGDTTAIDTTDVRRVNIDTLSFETGPVWLPFDNRNVTELLVGLNTPAIVDTLEVEIEITVIDDVPVSSGLLFTAFGNGENEPTLDTSPAAVIDSVRYAVTDSVPRFNPAGKIVRYTGGIKIPSFVTRQFQIQDNVTFLQRRFLLTMKSSSGSTITNEFTINFCDQQTYINRQCWLSGEPECENLF